MVDFESWIRDKISREVAQGRRADSESEVSDSSDDEVRRPRPSKLRSRTRRDVDRGWCCECDKCIEREDVPRGNTYREYDDVDPAVVPGNRDHFFSLMDRDVLAFALKERKFGTEA